LLQAEKDALEGDIFLMVTDELAENHQCVSSEGVIDAFEKSG
jgi:hypothetical protein